MTKFKNLTSFLVLVMLAATSMMTAQDKKVTDVELQKFATAFQKVQMENQKAQQDMVQLIKDEGMETQRFVEIQQAESNPSTETDASASEMKSYNKVMADIKKMEPKINAKMEAQATSSGLELDRYKAIAVQLQNSPDLQNRLKEMLQ